ncbi:MAG: hypothetical protein RLN63_03550 [Miltoncostaeaceae bacterium]
MRRTAALVCALGIGVGAAACGGDDEAEDPTVAEPTTAVQEAPEADTVLDTTEAEAPTAPTGDLADRLPADAPLEGTARGEVQTLATATELVDALYAEGDSAKGAAVESFEEAGFAGAVLRDDTGTNPQEGLALHRLYVMELGGEQEAQAEVIRAAQEILAAQGGGVQETGSFPVEGIPGATGVLVVQEASGQVLIAAAVLFPLGPYVYGFQAVAAGDPSRIDRDALEAAARAQYEAGQ